MSDLDAVILKAGVDRLRLDSALNVQDGEVTNGTPRPYVLVYCYITRPRSADSNALDGLSRTIFARWVIHSVGDSREAATLVDQHVCAQLLDVQLTIPGFPTVGVGLIEQESAQQPQADKTTGVLVMDAISIYKTRVTI